MELAGIIIPVEEECDFQDSFHDCLTDWKL